ncbi:hypothetical protein ACYSNO_11370 [Enterococcus sp. LJL98]
MKFYHLIGVSFFLVVFEFFLLTFFDLAPFFRVLFACAQGFLFFIYLILYFTYFVARRVHRKKQGRRFQTMGKGEGTD